jgi:L-methionine (R)-S-oxide reductase
VSVRISKRHNGFRYRERICYLLSVFDPLLLSASPADRADRYVEVARTIESLLEGENDWVAAMATVASELHQAFDYYDWTGFYRAQVDQGEVGEQLVIGPYQGGHGCLRIPFGRGVCGAAARTRQAQLVPDVSAFEGHIACSSSTRSELVVPIVAPGGRLIAVLDVDSDAPAAFTEIDREGLQKICERLGAKFGEE